MGTIGHSDASDVVRERRGDDDHGHEESEGVDDAEVLRPLTFFRVISLFLAYRGRGASERARRCPPRGSPHDPLRAPAAARRSAMRSKCRRALEVVTTVFQFGRCRGALAMTPVAVT